jgi:hypothetical protein
VDISIQVGSVAISGAEAAKYGATAFVLTDYVAALMKERDHQRIRWIAFIIALLLSFLDMLWSLTETPTTARAWGEIALKSIVVSLMAIGVGKGRSGAKHLGRKLQGRGSVEVHIGRSKPAVPVLPEQNGGPA